MAEDTKKERTTDQGIPMVTLTIDDRRVTVGKGTTVLEAARSVGIDIPTFCWHPKLKSVGACRICYVEIEKFPKLMVSCATEVMPDMVVRTDTDQVKQGRKAIIEFILANHPLDCPTCDKGGECDLQNLTFAHGVDDNRFDFRKNRFVDEGMTTTFDDLKIGPEIWLNRNRCILCYRCVRSNKEAFGEYDLGVYERGDAAQINAAPGQQVANPFSGNLVEACPVGALTNSDWRYKVRVWLTQTTQSLCNFTSSGTNTLLYGLSHKNEICRSTSRPNDDIDDGWLADITRYSYQIVTSPDRLQTPLIKKDGRQVPATWDEALDCIKKRLGDIKDKKGAVCIGGLAAPNLDNASLYYFSKFFRVVLGSNNLDFRTDYRMLPKEEGTVFSRLCEQPFRIADVDDSDAIVVFGSDLVREHPNEYLRIRKARNFGQPKIYSLNPYSVKSADVADREMVYRIGTDEVVINGICLAGIEDNLVDSALGAALKQKIAPATLAEAAALSEVEPDDLRALARSLVEGKKVTFIIGELISRSPARETIGAALANLHKLFGIGAKGQMAALARYANSRGAQMLGLMPYPSESVRNELTAMWGGYPEGKPHNTDAMLALMKKEEISGMLILGGNPVRLYPDRNFVREGLEKLDFLVVSDMFETETTELADVVLPLCSWAEYAGDYVNLEGRLQTAHAVVKPIGQARPGYEIMARLAEAFGLLLFKNDQQYSAEVGRLLDLVDAPALPDEFLVVQPEAEEPDGDCILPVLLCDDPHHSGYLTQKAKSLVAFSGEPYVEMSAELAGRYHIAPGDSVRLESPVGKVILPAKISDWLDNDVLLLPRNFASAGVTALLMRKKRIDRVMLSKVEK
ncbi:MAG: NADH-quinone oxidoreductase subunit NuoG [bacterium]